MYSGKELVINMINAAVLELQHIMQLKYYLGYKKIKD